MQLTAVGQTHTGCVRTQNQDAYLIRERPTLLAVADGMGGHDAGEVASAMLVAELRHVAEAGIEALVTDAKQRIAHVNRLLLSKAQERRIIGATLVCVIAAEDGVAVLWVGDSRAYVLRNRQLMPLTTDHSTVQSMVSAQILTKREARGHPLSNQVTRAVGMSADIDIAHHPVSLYEDDRLILCSDGLTECVTSDEIAAQLRFRDDRQAGEALIASAVARGAPDNVTVICATVSR